MTIKERADAYIGHPEDIDAFLSKTIKRNAYICGAKEQKGIDIDNACSILCHHVCPYDSNQCNAKCETWEMFRRMMEE